MNLVKERPLKTFLFRPLDKFKFMYGFILQSSFITSISDFFKLCFRPCFCLRWLCNVQCIVVFFYYYSYFTSRCCSQRVLFLSAGAFFLQSTVLLFTIKILRGQAAHKELCYLLQEHFYCLFGYAIIKLAGCVWNGPLDKYRHSSTYTINLGTQEKSSRSKNRVNQGYLGEENRIEL